MALYLITAHPFLFLAVLVLFASLGVLIYKEGKAVNAPAKKAEAKPVRKVAVKVQGPEVIGNRRYNF